MSEGIVQIQSLYERCTNRKVKWDTCSVRRILKGMEAATGEGTRSECELGKPLDRPARIAHPRQREHCTETLRAREDRECLRRFRIMQRKETGQLIKSLDSALQIGLHSVGDVGAERLLSKALPGDRQRKH